MQKDKTEPKAWETASARPHGRSNAVMNVCPEATAECQLLAEFTGLGEGSTGKLDASAAASKRKYPPWRLRLNSSLKRKFKGYPPNRL